MSLCLLITYIVQYAWQLNNTTTLQCRNTIVGNYRKGRSNTRLGWKNQLLPCKLLSDWVHNNDQAIIYQQNHSNNLDAMPKVSLHCNFLYCFVTYVMILEVSILPTYLGCVILPKFVPKIWNFRNIYIAVFVRAPYLKRDIIWGLFDLFWIMALPTKNSNKT